MNDGVYIWGLLIFFISTGLIVQFIEKEVANVTITTNDNTDDLNTEMQKSHSTTLGGIASFFTILGKMILSTIWTFGLPTLVNLLFLTPMRIFFWFLVVRNILGSGG